MSIINDGDGGEGEWNSLIFEHGGYALIHTGNKYKRLGQMYNQYVTVILQMTDGSIERIAEDRIR